MKAEEILPLLEELAKRESADIYLFNAGMDQRAVDKFRHIVCDKPAKRSNALLFLATFGGDPDAAYRLAACLQRNYTKVAVYIFGFCKSAGTLTVIGAHRVIMGNFGELGPLDVQLVKPDEIIPTSSGLDIFQALAVITNSAFEAFEEYFLKVVSNSGGSISAKTAAEIARGLAVGLFEPMTEQIDPERLGEVQRAINIANAYGQRLERESRNLKNGALDKLVQGYPTHGFVIDIVEAKTIFNEIRHADELESKIAVELSRMLSPVKDPLICDLVNFFTTTVSKGSANETKQKSKPKRKAKVAQRPADAEVVGEAGNIARLR